MKLPRWDFFDVFLAGFLLYSLGFSFSYAEKLSYVTCQLIQIAGLALLFVSALKLVRLHAVNRLMRLGLFLYFSWSALVIGRGFLLEADFVKFLLFDAWFGMMPYLAPLILLFSLDLWAVKRIFWLILLLGFCFLAFNAFFIDRLIIPETTDLFNKTIVEIFSKTLAIPAGFILLTYPYHSRRVNMAALVVLLAALALGLLKARRGLVIMAAAPLFISCALYLVHSRAKLLLAVISVLFAVVLGVYGVRSFGKGALFSSVKERGMEDTRSNVEKRFYADMKPLDWVIGRGINGTYYIPGFLEDGSDFRSVIETDYLNIILKGGAISLGLLLGIALPAMFLGIFRSKNLLSKAAGIWIFLWILNLYPSTVFAFTMNYLLVWVGIRICLSKALRSIPDEALTCFFTAHDLSQSSDHRTTF